MAERREVLELGPDDELDTEDAPEPENQDDEPGEEAEEQELEEGGDAETEIPSFGEEAAPAPESDNSVIRELRAKYREVVRENAELKRGAKPAKIEVGEKPTLESCEYDEERFETALDAWKGRKAQAEQQDREQQQRTEREREAWTERAKAYEDDKQRIAVSDYDDAEAAVFDTLPEPVQALIMLTGKPAALIYALSRTPAKLEELSKLDLARAAMMIGKLEDKLTVTKRALPDPDRPVRGNARPATADKELARLEKEAARTGDRTEVVRYKRKLKAQAN